MLCPHCGADNPDDAIYCSLCAMRFSANQVEEPDSQYPPSDWLAGAPVITASDAHSYDEPSSDRSIRRRRRLRSLLTNLVILLVIAGLVVTGVLLYRHYRKPGIAGKYIHEKNSSESLTLDSEKTFTNVETTMTVRGTYEVSGTTITLTPTNPAGLPSLSGTINGNTITDPDGERWTKQY